MPAYSETIISSSTIYKGKILDLEKAETRIETGRTAFREIIRHKQAVVVLIETSDGRFVFVRQYRVPVNGFLVEAVAGGMEDGETPEQAARRETAEESGCRITSIRPLGRIVSTPGFCDEILHCFHARVDGAPGEQNPDADESLDVLFLSREEFIEKVRSGEIYDSKTLAAWTQYDSGH